MPTMQALGATRGAEARSQVRYLLDLLTVASAVLAWKRRWAYPLLLGRSRAGACRSLEITAYRPKRGAARRWRDRKQSLRVTDHACWFESLPTSICKTWKMQQEGDFWIDCRIFRALGYSVEENGLRNKVFVQEKTVPTLTSEACAPPSAVGREPGLRARSSTAAAARTLCGCSRTQTRCSSGLQVFLFSVSFFFF